MSNGPFVNYLIMSSLLPQALRKAPSLVCITGFGEECFNPTGSWTSLERALELKAIGLGMRLEKKLDVALSRNCG